MTDIDQGGYIAGEYKVPPQGREVSQERKSDPLVKFLPDRNRYLRPAVDRYFDPAHVQLEWQRLWTKVWLCAGRVADLPQRGSWFRFDFGRESFIITRSEQDEIRALYNVCQHRANRIVDDCFGRSKAFVCSYHSWRYDSAGTCIHVTDRELFRKEALDGSLNLRAVRCETHGGFVFINMDNGAAPLADFIGEVADITSGYQLERMEVRADAVLELACNWKTTLDAFSENYHVHMTHQFAMPITEDKLGQLDFYPGGHTRRIVPLGNPAVRRGHAAAIHPMQALMLEAAGIDPNEFAGGAMDVRRAVQQAKRRMSGQADTAYRHLSDNQLTDDWAVNLFPNMHWSLHAEGALVMRYHPHVDDPNRCSLHILVLAHPGLPFSFYLPEAREFEPSGRPKRIFVRHDDPDVKERIGQLLWEDIRNTRETQRGLQSRGFGRMRLSEHEQAIMYQYATMDRYLNTEYGSGSAAHSAVKG